MKHYLVVLLPQPDAGWRAHFPDFPGCRSDGPTVEIAIAAAKVAATAVARTMAADDRPLPIPQSYEEIRHGSNGWATERGIDWTNAVVTLVPLSVEEL